MNSILKILTPACTRCHVDAPSRKRALEAASEVLAATHPALSAREIFDQLMGRERLGSTGLGEGAAIPHCRIPCDEIMGAALTLRHAVDYDAVDNEPVDMLFVMVVPPDEPSAHLDLLAELAALFGNAENRARLRAAKSDAELYEVMHGLASSQAA